MFGEEVTSSTWPHGMTVGLVFWTGNWVGLWSVWATLEKLWIGNVKLGRSWTATLVSARRQRRCTALQDAGSGHMHAHRLKRREVIGLVRFTENHN